MIGIETEQMARGVAGLIAFIAALPFLICGTLDPGKHKVIGVIDSSPSIKLIRIYYFLALYNKINIIKSDIVWFYFADRSNIRLIL